MIALVTTVVCRRFSGRQTYFYFFGFFVGLNSLHDSVNRPVIGVILQAYLFLNKAYYTGSEIGVGPITHVLSSKGIRDMKPRLLWQVFVV